MVAQRWLSCGETSCPEGTDWLSERESGYLETIRFTKRRTEFLLRRHTGKRAVAAALGLPADPSTLARVEILNRLTGAPYVQIDGERAALDISLTDRAGWGVALIGSEGSMAAGTLGVDLEIVEPRTRGFVSDFLTPPEQEYVAARGAEEAAGELEGPGVAREHLPALGAHPRTIAHEAAARTDLSLGTGTRSPCGGAGNTRSSTLAEDSTPGMPAPGWVPAPTKYRPSTSSERL